MTKLGPSLLVLLFSGAVILIHSPTTADWDASVQGSLRSYPFGGSVDLEAGRAFPLWGKAAEGGKSSPLMGFIRPELKASLAGFYNSGSAAIEVFPLGFLGVKAGYEILNNEEDYQDFDCSTFRCHGTWTKSFIEAQIALAWRSVFMVGKAARQELKADSRNSGELIEPTYALLVPQEREKLDRLEVLAGVNWNSTWQTLAVLQNQHFLDQDKSSQFQYLLMRWISGSWSVMGGVGLVRSPLFETHGTVIGGLRWEIDPSIKLF